MSSYDCRFCGKTGSEKAEFVFVPVADPASPLLMKERVLCAFCATYARSHFLAEAHVTAADILEPEDEAYENATDY